MKSHDVSPVEALRSLLNAGAVNSRVTTAGELLDWIRSLRSIFRAPHRGRRTGARVSRHTRRELAAGVEPVVRGMLELAMHDNTIQRSALVRTEPGLAFPHRLPFDVPSEIAYVANLSAPPECDCAPITQTSDFDPDGSHTLVALTLEYRTGQAGPDAEPYLGLVFRHHDIDRADSAFAVVLIGTDGSIRCQVHGLFLYRQKDVEISLGLRTQKHHMFGTESRWADTDQLFGEGFTAYLADKLPALARRLTALPDVTSYAHWLSHVQREPVRPSEPLDVLVVLYAHPDLPDDVKSWLHGDMLNRFLPETIQEQWQLPVAPRVELADESNWHRIPKTQQERRLQSQRFPTGDLRPQLLRLVVVARTPSSRLRGEPIIDRLAAELAGRGKLHAQSDPRLRDALVILMVHNENPETGHSISSIETTLWGDSVFVD